MKELERRISEIDKGEMETLMREFDYRKLLLHKLPDPSSVNKAIYQSHCEGLLIKIDSILNREKIIVNVGVKIYDENWDTKTNEDQLNNYKEFKKAEKVQDIVKDSLSDFDSDLEIEDGMDWLTKFVAAPQRLIANVTEKLEEELNVYSKALKAFIEAIIQKPIYDQINDIEPEISNIDQKRINARNNLTEIKNYLTSNDFEQIVSLFCNYKDNRKFPGPIKKINVSDCDNVRKFGWTLAQAFKKTNNSRKYPPELFAFVKHNISIFEDVRYNPVNRRKCNVYLYMTQDPY